MPRINDRNEVKIPKKYSDHLGLQPNDCIDFELGPEHLLLRKVSSAHHQELAVATFHELARTLADNFTNNSYLSPDQSQKSHVILVLGANASDIDAFPPWSEVKKQVFERASRLFANKDLFLREICRVFSEEFGSLLWGRTTPEEREQKILRDARVEQISNVACNLLGHADYLIRDLISEIYAASETDDYYSPVHMTYELISHLVMHGFVDHIVTMNFDEILDTALQNEMGPDGFFRIVTGHEAIESNLKNQPRLIKIHGTVSSPESLRFTYTDVSVLTPAFANHLTDLLDVAADGCECLNLISFGYSWKDPDFASWLVGNLDKFENIFIVRRNSELPEVFGRLLDGKERRDRDRFKVLSARSLCAEGSAEPQDLATSSDFWWSLTETIYDDYLHDDPLIPISRHLILGLLLSHPSGFSQQSPIQLVAPLPQRVRLEILLHLLKGKGMINTSGTPDSPRIEKYYELLRDASDGQVTMENFLLKLHLDHQIRRSSEPEARDTFFSLAEDPEEFVGMITEELTRGSLVDVIRKPVLGDKSLVRKERPLEKLIEKHVRKILKAPEIEVARVPDHRLPWLFSQAIPILSFPRFAQAISDTLKEPWTDLLVVLESKRWMSYRWVKKVLEDSEGGQLLLVSPSMEGIGDWGVGEGLREEDNRIFTDNFSKKLSVLEVELPWWKHDKHMLLPVFMDENELAFRPGIFFTREYQSPVIAPVLLKKRRDAAKLLSIFLNYIAKAPEGGPESEIAKRIREIGWRALDTKDVFPTEMQKLVEESLDRLEKGAAVP